MEFPHHGGNQFAASQFAPPLMPPRRTDCRGMLEQREFPQAIRTTVHIDSRDRDFDKHPSSSQFTVDLPEALKNVSSAVLVGAELPLSYYVFSAARNNLFLRVVLDTVSRDVTVGEGNYTTTQMEAALKTALQAQFPGRTWTVAMNPTTMRCAISVDSGAVYVDATHATSSTDWGLGYYLGFQGGVFTYGSGTSTTTRATAAAAATATVTGSRVANLNPENYLLLDIEELNGLSQAAMYNSGGMGRLSFAKVPLNGDSYSFNFYDKTLTYVEQRPQLTRLERMRVAVRFHDGTLVDLNGCEWSFSLEFACTLARGVM